MATQTTASAPAEPTAVPRLQRTDTWGIWAGPVSFLLLFSAFGLWVTFRAFQNDYYDTELLGFMAFPGSAPQYLSPLYSPTFNATQLFGWHVGSYAISPALWILVFPL